MRTSATARTRSQARQLLKGRKAFVTVAMTEWMVPTTHAAVIDLIDPPIPADGTDYGHPGTELFIIFDGPAAYVHVEERTDDLDDPTPMNTGQPDGRNTGGYNRDMEASRTPDWQNQDRTAPLPHPVP